MNESAGRTAPDGDLSMPPPGDVVLQATGLSRRFSEGGHGHLLSRRGLVAPGGGPPPEGLLQAAHPLQQLADTPRAREGDDDQDQQGHGHRRPVRQAHPVIGSEARGEEQQQERNDDAHLDLR